MNALKKEGAVSGTRTALKGWIRKFPGDNRGFGMQEVLGIAAVLIVAAFVLIPSLRTFAQSVMTGLTNWYTNTVQTKLFPTI